MKSLHAFAAITLVFGGVSIYSPVRVSAQTPSDNSAKPEWNCLSNALKAPAQGDRAISRYEFAVGLNQCLNEAEQRIQRDDYATKSDLERLTTQQQELNQDIRQLNDRVDALSGDKTPTTHP